MHFWRRHIITAPALTSIGFDCLYSVKVGSFSVECSAGVFVHDMDDVDVMVTCYILANQRLRKCLNEVL